MSRSSQLFLTIREIESKKLSYQLSNYEEIQLRLHGNILRERKKHPIFEELGNEEDYAREIDNQNAIYSQLNPAQ